MTVKELIKELSLFDQDLPVEVSIDVSQSELDHGIRAFGDIIEAQNSSGAITLLAIGSCNFEVTL